MQRKNAECHAWDYLGWVTARFRLDGYRAIPVSSHFEPYQEPYLGVAGQRTAHSWRQAGCELPQHLDSGIENRDRKSTRLNSSHTVISYAVFCLKKKKKNKQEQNVKQDTE